MPRNTYRQGTNHYKQFLYRWGNSYQTALFQGCHSVLINLAPRADDYRALTLNYLTKQTILLSDWPYRQDTLCCPAAELKRYVHPRRHLAQGNLPDMFTDMLLIIWRTGRYVIIQIDKLDRIQDRGAFFFPPRIFLEMEGEREACVVYLSKVCPLIPPLHHLCIQKLRRLWQCKRMSRKQSHGDPALGHHKESPGLHIVAAPRDTSTATRSVLYQTETVPWNLV